MWKRAELKRRGRENFRKNYWPAAAVSLVLAVMMTNIGGRNPDRRGKTATWCQSTMDEPSDSLEVSDRHRDRIDQDILYIFIFAVIEVGGAAFYIRNREEQAKAGLVFSGFFDSRYKKYMKGMFMMHLELIFWYLMLLVPGIIKSYAFRMVPYLLAEDPDLTFAEMLHISEEMMRGQKWKAFLLDVSFLGWRVLTTLTLGIPGIFFTGPYIDAVNAEPDAQHQEERRALT